MMIKDLRNELSLFGDLIERYCFGSFSSICRTIYESCSILEKFNSTM